jgi:hypothetical protein
VKWVETVTDLLLRDSHLYGRCCIPAVLHSGLRLLRHQISSDNPPGPSSTRGGGSFKSIAIAVCSICSIDTDIGTLINSRSTAQFLILTFGKVENWLPSCRICTWVPELYSYARGVPIHPRFSPNAMCPCHTQCHPSRPHYAWKRE